MRTPVLLLVAFALLLPTTSYAGKAFDTDDVTGRQLLDYLDHPDWHFRHDACEEVGERKIVQAEEQLVALATGDASERVRRTCLEALKDLGSRMLVPSAESIALEDGDPGNRKYALDIIEDHGGERSGPVLGRVLEEDPDEDLRRKAAVILRKKGWTNATESLARAASADPDKGVREAALEGLVLLGGPDHRPAIHRIMLEDPDEKVRLTVVEMIEKAPTAADRDALVAALDDTYSHVQRHAARALVKLGDRSVGPILRDKALDQTDRKVAEEFNEAASRLGG